MTYTVGDFYRFGDFTIDLEQRELLRGGQTVPLTPKVFDTLLVLVEQHGRIVRKEELMSRLWPDSFVEDSNLVFNIQQLRKALGDNARNPVYIETIPRRGYRFIGHVAEGAGNITVPSATWAQLPKLPHFRPLTIAVATFILLSASSSAWYLTRAKKDHGRSSGAGKNSESLPPKLRVKKLTDTGKNRHAVISPDGQYVAYTVEVKEKNSIWLRQLATDSAREILSPTERLGGLAFSHDGQHLYFIKGPADSFALYRVALPLGGVPVRLIEKPQGSYSFSPDDRQIAFVRYSEDDKQCALMIATIDGQQERAIAIHEQPDRFNTPAWSPDGKSIAVAVGPSDSGSQQVRVVQYDLATGAEAELTPFRWFHISRIVWLPDQHGLAIAGNRTLGQTKQLWRLNSDTGEVVAMTDGLTSYADVSLTNDGTTAVAPQVRSTSSLWIGPAKASHALSRLTHAAEDFCWTADGRIVYSSYNNANANLWTMQPDGTDQRQLTYEGERNSNPVATADGRYIFFSSNRSGVLQIWRIDSDGSNATQLTSGAGHSLPGVSLDGRWVYYNSVDDWSLWKVSTDGGEPVRLTNSYAIYPAVSPDGKLVAVVSKGIGKTHKLLILSATDGKTLRELDVSSLTLSGYRLRWSGRSLLFAASRDGVAGIYKQPLSGGPAELLVTLEANDLFDFGYSPNGNQLAVTRGEYQFDVVLLSFEPQTGT